MKAKIKTEALKNLMAKAAKGAGNNKLLPITSLMELNMQNNDIVISTTDMVHYLYVSGKLEEADFESVSIVIEVEKFAKLISKFTTEFVTIEDCGKYLEVVGNGKYSIDIPLDENGMRIEFPKIQYNITDTFETTRAFLELIVSVCGASVAKALDVPVYTNYYVGKSILTTDTFAISAIAMEWFKGRTVLLPNELMDLLAVLDGDAVIVNFTDANRIEFGANGVRVLGRLADGVDEYAVDAINRLVDQKFSRVCKFKRAAMLAALERVSLFVSPYDDRAITLTFTESGITVESKRLNGVETVPYSDEADEEPFVFVCGINVDMLIAQLKANVSDVVTMEYGETNSIKFVDGRVVQVLALLEA